MRENTLVNTQVTYATVKLLKRIRQELEKEQEDRRSKKRITKREVCEELVKRCLIKRVV